jgi:hypothetical protein
MRIMFEVVIAWVVMSCTLGPVLTWAFFYSKRRARAIGADRDRWAAAHPTAAPELMPAWLKWENAGDDHVENGELELHEAGPRRRPMLTTAVVVLALAIIGSLGAILLRNGAAAEADASIVKMGRSAP